MKRVMLARKQSKHAFTASIRPRQRPALTFDSRRNCTNHGEAPQLENERVAQTNAHYCTAVAACCIKPQLRLSFRACRSMWSYRSSTAALLVPGLVCLHSATLSFAVVNAVLYGAIGGPVPPSRGETSLCCTCYVEGARRQVLKFFIHKARPFEAQGERVDASRSLLIG